MHDFQLNTTESFIVGTDREEILKNLEYLNLDIIYMLN
jgi:hypothetical protein